MIKAHITVILFTFTALLATAALAKDEIYRWVDEKGNVHFSETRPKEKAVEKIEIKNKVPTAANQGIDASKLMSEHGRGLIGGSKNLSSQGQQQVGAEQCEIVAANLAALNSDMAVEKRDDLTGEIIHLSEEARALEIEYFENYLSIYCVNFEY